MRVSFIVLILVLFTKSNGFVAQAFSPEFYWLGYAAQDEKVIGKKKKKDPANSILRSYVHENDSLEMKYVSQVCNVKYRQRDYQADCSTCNLWHYSKKVNKKWVTGKYYTFTKTKYDSTLAIQWYKPQFNSQFLIEATEIEKISFIAGLFLKSGSSDSTSFNLKIIESPERAECVVNLLRMLKCSDVSIEIQRNVEDQGVIMDHIAFINFTPSEALASYLAQELEIKRRKKLLK